VQEHSPTPQPRFENELLQYCGMHPSWRDEGYESELDEMAGLDYGSECDSFLSEME
jgi:hypothetical protein